MIGEVDVFQTSTEDELYAHLNINYLRLPSLPSSDHYDRLLEALEKGDGFISTGEIMLSSFQMIPNGSHGVRVQTEIKSTFPLRFAELVWGDGNATQRKILDLQSTPSFDDHTYTWIVDTPGCKWARFAVWDVAGNGAFTNPTWSDRLD